MMRTTLEECASSYTLVLMNTTQDPIPLFGDDSFESVTDTASNSEGSSADDGHPEHTDSRAEELAAALNSASAESASENPASDTLVQPAVTSPGEPYVPASSAVTRIGSEQDMDAWLSGDPGIQTGQPTPSAGEREELPGHRAIGPYRRHGAAASLQ